MNSKTTRVTLLIGLLFALTLVGIAFLVSTAVATTIDLRPAVEAGRGSIPADKVGKTFRLYRRVDFGTDAVTSSDAAIIFTIPANTIVREIIYENITAEGGTAVCDVFFKDTEKGTDANFNSAAGLKVLMNAGSAFCVDEATTVSLQPDNNLDHAVVDIWVTGERLPETD